MSFGGDERAVSVVVGAVLMLGILVSALALYQANVVPDQNQQVEWNHHADATASLLDVRNGIVDAGYENRSRDVSMPLGTRYPSRTWAINPPDPRGTIETVPADGPVEIEFESGDNYRFATSFVTYAPEYHEYDGPRTVIEHGFVYDGHRDANVTRDRGSVVSDDRIVIPLVVGNLSETRTDAVSVTVETLDRYHVAEPTGYVNLTLPSTAADAWAGDYDGAVVRDGDVFFERLDVDEVLVAQIGVGDDRQRNETTSDELARFGEPRSDGGGDADGPYDVWWSGDQADANVEDCDDVGCDEDFRVERGTASASFVAETDVSGSPSVDFAFRDPDGVGVDVGSEDAEFTDGSAAYALENFDAEGVLELLVYSGGTSDRISVVVDESDPVEGVGVTIQGTNSPVDVGEELVVTAQIENTGDTEQTQTIELVTDGVVRDAETVTLSSGESVERTFAWSTGSGDAGNYTARVSSDDDVDSVGVTVSALTFAGGEGTFDRNDDGTDSLIAFDVENERADDVTLTAVELVDTSAPANEIDGDGRGQWADREVLVDVTGDGSADATVNRNNGFAFGERMEFGSGAVLGSGDVARYNVGEIRNDGATVSMGGESVTVVLYYEDADGVERYTEFKIEDL